ncbi:MAG: molybdopterin oxidoreductase family protein, partial [Mesorhizobium sp.]
LRGPDPREMAKADCVVIWGTNAVVTQVNVMTHATRARKERGAKIVVIDIYDNATMKQADLGLVLKPGTDGALACAVMHVLFRDGLADRAYLEAFAKLVGTTKKTYFRLGYGFARQRNGSINMHAASSIAAVTGAWQYEGGGAFHSNSGIFKLNQDVLEGAAMRDP